MSGLDEFKQKQNKGRFREIIELIIVFVIVVFIFKFVLMSVRVSGDSMKPNYVNGERGIMLRTNPINKPKYGSVVVVNALIETEEAGSVVKKRAEIVKRVYGMPKDTVEIKENQVFVNGEQVEDLSRAYDTTMEDYPLVTLADDEYFILGDNRNVSQDSRIIGPVKEKDIDAVRGFTYWPITRVGLMK